MGERNLHPERRIRPLVALKVLSEVGETAAEVLEEVGERLICCREEPLLHLIRCLRRGMLSVVSEALDKFGSRTEALAKCESGSRTEALDKCSIQFPEARIQFPAIEKCKLSLSSKQQCSLVRLPVTVRSKESRMSGDQQNEIGLGRLLE